MMDDKDYKVGYKNPPKQTQFQKGQSGNPSGRRKRSRTSNQLLINELYSPIFITENGKRKRITKLEAMIKRATHDSINGKSESLLKLMRLIEQFGTDIDEPQPVQVVVNIVDASKK